MSLRLPSLRMTVAVLMAAAIFVLVSPLSRHVLWHGASYADEQNPQGSPSNDNMQTRDADGNYIRCRDIPEAKGGALVGYIVPCIIYTIENTSVDFSQKMIDWLMPTVWAFITFVVTMFGLKILQGEGEVHKHGLLLLLKIGMVVAVLHAIPTVAIPQLYQIMKETQEVVANTIQQNSEDLHCDADKYGDENTLVIWKELDCVLGKLWGFTMGTDGHPSMLLAASVFGLLGGFFFGGTFGVALFVALVGMLWSFFAMIFKTIFVFLNSYVYATLMLLIAPLFVPLTLLKVTGGYFDRWWSSILACILLPLIVTAYVMFAMLIYDKLLFGPDAEINELFEYSHVKDAEKAPRQACDRSIGSNPTQRSQLSGIIESALYKSPFMQNFSTPTMSAANNLCAGLNIHAMHVTDLQGKQYQSEKDGFVKLFMHALKMLIMALLVNFGFKEVLNYAKIIVGSYAVSSSLDAGTLMESRLQQGFSAARAGLEAGFKDEQGRTTSGTAFIQRIPIAARDALIGDPQRQDEVPGFLGGITRSTD